MQEKVLSADYRQLYCSFENSDYPLLAELENANHPGSIQIADFAFDKSFSIHPTILCEKFLSAFWHSEKNSSIKPSGTLQLTEMITTNHARTARLSGKSKDQMYQACTALPFCKIRFPFFLTSINAASAWLTNSVGYDNSVACKTITKNPEPLERLRKFEISPIATSESMSFSITPILSYSDRLIEILEKEPNPTVYVATMSLSMRMIEKLKATLRKKKDAKVLLLFDLNNLISSNETAQLLHELPENLDLIPIHPNLRPIANFHLKGLATTAGELFLSSSNIAITQMQTILDLGFSMKSESAAHSYIHLLRKVALSSCQNHGIYQCLLPVGAEETLYKKLELQAKKSCKWILEHPETATEQSSFALSTTHNLPEYLSQKILNAQSHVAIFAHKVSHPKILDALQKAKSKGVAIELYIGDPMARQFSSSGSEGRDWRVFSFNPKKYLQSHSKGVLVDSKEVIHCSGNFTLSGLEHSLEVCWRQTQPHAISSYFGYLNTIRDFSLGPRSHAKVDENIPPHFDKTHFSDIIFIPNEDYSGNPGVRKTLEKHLKPLKRLGPDFYVAASDRLRHCINRLPPQFLYSSETATSCLLPGNDHSSSP